MQNMHDNLTKSSFFFGAATSAHQVEGNNIHSDWWKYEKDFTKGISSGRACASYELFKEDRKLLQEMECNSYRFSIEWSRIEPREGEFVQSELDRYISQIDDLLEHNITPLLTLHHFSNPAWFEDQGGWTVKDAYKKYLRFLEFILPSLAGKVKYFVTFNEPNIYIYSKYIVGSWFPGQRRPMQLIRCLRNFIPAHRKAYKMIKDLDPESQIGIASQFTVFHPAGTHFDLLNWVMRKTMSLSFNFLTYNLFWRKHLDYIGINFYTRTRVAISFSDAVRLNFNPEFYEDQKMHFLQFPEDLKLALRQVKKYGLPVIVTENGMLTNDDRERQDYLKEIFKYMQESILDGVKLIGYFHWSLMDNFEWSFAFKPKFGLYSVNHETFAREAKPSAQIYRDLIRHYRKKFEVYEIK